MPTVVNFEVYAQTEQGWVLQGRFPGDDKAGAVEEAKNIEHYAKAPVKVVRETYYSESNFSEERIVYTGKIKPRPEMPGQGGRNGRGGTTGGRGPGGGANSPFSEHDVLNTYGNSGNGKGASDFVFRLLMVLILSLLIAICGTGVCSLILTQLARSGLSLGSSTQSFLLFGVFITLFLISVVPMVSAYVPLEGMRRRTAGHHHDVVPAHAGDYHADDFSPKGGAKDGAQTAPGASAPPPPDPLDAMLPDDGPWPTPTVPEEHDPGKERAKQAADDLRERQRLKEEAEKRKAERKAAQDAAVAAAEAAMQATPDPAPSPFAEEPDPAADLSQAYEQARVTIMRFLGEVVAALKTSQPVLDAYNKFGVNLYLAGACAALSSTRGLSKDEQSALVREAVEVVGSKPEQARHLILRLDTYGTEPRYQAMIDAGQTAMQHHLTGDTDPFHALGGVMKDWNTPQTRQLANSMVTILFTDMVGSTDMTHQMGDVAAQDVIRAHNSIVRTALSQHRGKEVKHTGDGIMASFDEAVDAVRASIQIQRAVKAHNQKWTKQPLHLRIGMNTGEPIIEENDYFGATVQIAARVCAAAGMDQIWIGPTSYEQVNRAPDISLFSHGAQRLKGVRDEQTLHEVVWNGDRAAELDAIRKFREADRAAAGEAAAARPGAPASPAAAAAGTKAQQDRATMKRKLPPLAPPGSLTASQRSTGVKKP
ncbi:adenylate/guanylate cyclase domain-containing protein [Novispirillum itersonii]|uniref:adenylate/guanylate cyclase domain-containing protein n=1 Tax=Novispirillum itersonii TaxID=189 RepID=UPI00037655A2|nr:adenylate/guanylate cyclase domain-containing protein [Novispirillum itersonii]